MPTENERKYVLINDPVIVYELSIKAQKILALEQAWLQNDPKENRWAVRIRKTFGAHYTDPEYTFTYKQHVEKRLIEIETVIEERDYYDLFRSVDIVLHKTRYVIPVGGFKWEIDLFYDRKRTNLYFIMAEIELPEGAKQPKDIPDFITENLLFEVPIGNKGFSSLELQNMDYATKLYNSLLEEKYSD